VKRRANVLWVIDHVCYDGSLHGGGRLFWNVLPCFDPERVRVVPCMLRATDTIRQLFANSPVPVRILDKAKFDPTVLWTFLRLIRKERIDVLHLHCYAASTFGRLAGWLLGRPTIIHDYDTEVYFPYPSYLGFADRTLASVTHSAIAASPMVKEFLQNKRRIPAEKIQMLFHAVPRARLEPVPGEVRRRQRSELGAAPGDRIVGTVTKLGPQRGNDDLLRCAAKVLERSPDVLFVIVYKPTIFHRLPNKKYVPIDRVEAESKRTVLENLAHELSIGHRVRLVESTDGYAEAMAAFDLMVAPFQSERFSSVPLLDAMAGGIPVVATDLGEQREIIRDGVTGSLVPPRDVDRMAQAISRILGGSGTLERMGRAARKRAEGYSVDACARRLTELYELAHKEAAGPTGRQREVA
jgi:glycosyltransferase involved in cell wall biosynthesis